MDDGRVALEDSRRNLNTAMDGFSRNLSGLRSDWNSEYCKTIKTIWFGAAIIIVAFYGAVFFVLNSLFGRPWF
ncbi:hypothetical protein [Methylobacterium indicum]|uniref:hypothetical protein n=1 Tax=Methylobacterium indicum TaxID=1775910 RepID=UPI000AF5223F|nr:hypothetical protein [Methylobacterium indicum]